jgi:hypothetical protein
VINRQSSAVAVAALSLIGQMYLIGTATADGCDILTSPSTCVSAEEGSIDINRSDRRSPTASIPETADRHNNQAELAAATQAFCQDAAANSAASGGAPQAIVLLCHGFAALPVAPSQGQVLTAFRELGLYRGAIRTDPVNSTLVNLETYFWCADAADRGCDLVGEGERTVTLLGQPVRIRPRIVDYAWDFGDDAGQEITTGRAAHTYQHAMVADVTLTLTWTADYAVGAGAFQPIGDTTTTTSPVRALPVREAESVIVAGG